MGSWRDISELHLAEQKFLDQNKAFEQVLEGTMAGYWDWMIQDNTEYLSPTFKQMFGYKDHEMENTPKSWQKIMHPDDLPGVFEIFEKHVESKGKVPYDCQVRYFHKDGSIVWVWCKGKVIEWSKEGLPIRMVGSHVDITKLKEIQESLARSNKELERFAYVASHDLQEPLRTIDDFIGLLKEEYATQLDNEAITYMGFVSSASRRMGQLVKGVLAYSRIGANPIVEKIDLNHILENVKNDLSIKIKERKVRLSANNLPIVEGVNSELHSLFLNLVGNAIKFVDKDTTPQIEIEAKNSKEGCQIAVKDNGIGVPEKNREKIFDVFKRLHSTDDYEGTGIGLAHCKKIVEFHGGKIWVESNSGQGSTFYFTLQKKRN